MNRPLYAFALFLFVWPTVTALSALANAVGMPDATRSFLTSAILVPAMVFAIVPTLTRLFAPRA